MLESMFSYKKPVHGTNGNAFLLKLIADKHKLLFERIMDLFLAVSDIANILNLSQAEGKYIYFFSFR